MSFTFLSSAAVHASTGVLWHQFRVFCEQMSHGYVSPPWSVSVPSGVVVMMGLGRIKTVFYEGLQFQLCDLVFFWSPTVCDGARDVSTQEASAFPIKEGDSMLPTHSYSSVSPHPLLFTNKSPPPHINFSILSLQTFTFLATCISSHSNF